MFERKIYDKLKQWKKRNGRSALLIEGARDIGKSTIVKQFAEKEYKTYIFIDFTKASKKVKEYFEEYMEDLDTLFMMLSTAYKTPLYARETLFVFDEVQCFPRARGCVKYLVADGRYDYIETGSLISIKENTKNIVIPSEEESVKMYPLDFEEFCWALGCSQLTDYIRDCFNKRIPLDPSLHDKAMLLFKQYMVVGGMPKCVDTFIKSGKNLIATDCEKSNILELYKKDIEKIAYCYKDKVRNVFDHIPTYLSKQQRRIVYTEIKQKTTAASYGSIVFWLADSMICNICQTYHDDKSGSSICIDEASVKCYMGDTGLLFSLALDGKEPSNSETYEQVLNGKLSMNNGMFFENAVAQTLSSSGHSLRSYSHYDANAHRNDVDVDFLIKEKNNLDRKIHPIGVKSTSKYSANTLKGFSAKFPDRTGCSIVILPREYHIENDTVFIPPYMAFCL